MINWRAVRLMSLCVFAMFLTWSDAAGQGMTTGGLQGVVSDGSGAPVADALVTLTDAGTGVKWLRTADLNGAFSFSQLAPGEYELLVENLGYIPLRVTNLPVRPGRRIGARVTIRTSTGAVAAPEVVRFESGALSGTQPQFSQWVPRSQLTRLPQQQRELTEVLRLSSITSQFAGIEGLPARMLGFAVDGVPFRSAAAMDYSTTASLPLGSFEAAELATNAADVERSGFAGPVLHGYSRRGSHSWTPSALAQYTASASADDIEDADRPTDAQGALIISGPIVRDSANVLFGAEFRRYDTPFAAPWMVAGTAGSALVSAAQTQNIGLQPFVQPGLARQDVFSVFARTDWQFSGRHRLEARAVYGSAPRMDASVQRADFSLLGSERSASSAALSAGFLSEFTPTTSNELRLAFTTDAVDAEWTGPFAATNTLPFTSIVGTGLGFGGSAQGATEFRRRQLTLSNALTTNMNVHQLKLGAAAEVGFIEQTRFFGAQPDALFGGVAQLEARAGLLVQPIGSPGVAEYTLSQVSAFMQDTWRPSAGVEIVAGIRYEHELLPSSDLQANEEWQRLTGLSNAELAKSYGKISPRFAFRWDPNEQHKWIFAGAVGVYHNEADVNALAAAIANDGRGRVLRRLGTVPTWAAALPTDTTGSLRALTLLPPGYRPPASLRASAGLTRVLGAHTALHITGNYRETHNLPRPVDLNRWSDAIAEAQDGRAIYGELVQLGGLIAADPASNRRFAGFDQVIGINADGRSQYTAGTLLLERADVAGLNFMASYTYSRTTDDWFGARAGLLQPQIAPALGAGQSDWEDGRSDFDVPHRAVLAVDVPAPAGIRVGALYRYESGVPFTPMATAGADLNGDGFANDPAFINDQIDGISELLNEWDCLRTQADSFAERNSCRGAGFHSLDLRLTAQVVRSDRSRLQLYVDALNVLQSEIGAVDAALYYVDADGQITTDTNGRVVVPLVSNPEFGEVRQRAALPRLIRLGMQFNW
ncbi:MAG TPA: TonB-dependent receptor [Longimicrobiales bacterium]|nr:TonB-dependent receptor [Longimicrobiales bacterium]